MVKHVMWLSFVFISLFSLPASACEPGNPRANDYMRRDDNRCEGIRRRSVVSGAIELISLTTGDETELSSTLSIRIPKLMNSLPNVLIRSISSRYQLDQMQFQDDGDYHLFNLPSTLLNRVNLSPSALRATATANEQVVFSPVILQRPSNSYKFVFYSSDSVRFTEAKIRLLTDLTEVASWGEQNPRRGEKSFEWANPEASPAGRYEFYYVAEIVQRNRPAERLIRSIVFEHNPDWLK